MHTPIDNQIKEALIERTAAYRQSGGGVIPFRTPEMQLIEQLWQAKHLASRLTRSTTAQFSLTHKAAGDQLKATDLGNELLQLLSSFTGASMTQYPCHLFDPRIDLFLDCAGKRNLTPTWRPFLAVAEAQLVPLVDALNGFVQDVRKRSATSSFKTKVVAFQTEIDKRHKEMQDYFNQLCLLYPAGHVIRMDFSYNLGQSLGNSPGKDMYQQVRVHGQALLAHMKRSLGSALAGYAWKRDFASSRGYQYHLVSVLSGPHPQELNNIVDSLGQEWCRQITGGMGLFFDCHAGRGHDFQYRGLIAMNRYAMTMQEHLRLVPVFMALTDGLTAFAPLGKEKQYGMGTLPKVARTKKMQPMPEYQVTEAGSTSGHWPFSMSMPTGLV